MQADAGAIAEPDDAELLLAAGADLGLYTSIMFPAFELAPHHALIINELEAVAAGKIDRLIILMPPRHGKSLLASEHFPAWYLGNNPDRSVIAMSSGQDLASTFGRSVRNQMLDPFYQAVFPGVILRKDSKASHRFNTPQRGAYLAAGRNASMTGRGAHLFLIDDPIKTMEEADSALIRSRVISIYESVVLTRLQKGAAVVLIQTRWHEDDLAGYVLRNHRHDKWRVLELPAINDRGEALWKTHFPINELLRKQASMSERAWSALYQQRPTSNEGAVLLRKYWKPWVDPVPEQPAMVLISLDTAYTESNLNDPSAFTCWHVVDTPYVHQPLKRGEVASTPDMRVKLLLRYAWRGRLEFPELIEHMMEAAKAFRIPDVPFRLLIEDKAAGLSVLQELRRRMPNVGLYVAKAVGSKVARANSVTAMMEAGRVYALAQRQRATDDDPDAPMVDVFKPWATMTIDECAAFPVGANDDLVDTVTHALRHIRDLGVELFPEDMPAQPPAHERGALY